MAFDQIEKVAVKQCSHCAGGFPAADNFCRWCGTYQKIDAATVILEPDFEESDCNISQAVAREYRLISGLLVNALTETIAIKTTPLRHNRFWTNVVATLITIPIWLMIVLLSPLDAYKAARAASSQVNLR